MWLLIVLASTTAEPLPVPQATSIGQAAAVAVRSATNPAEPRFESANFVVRSYVHPPRAEEVARLGEAVSCHLRRQCLGNEAAPSWRPKCQVVLHRTRQGYLAAVGPGGAETVGSAVVGIEAGRVLNRRVDLLAEDWNGALSALPHELVHIVFAELFPNAAPPRWAEEGFALLNDPADKRARHLRDLDYALRTRTTLPLGSLFSATDYPTGWQRAVFYGQSMSLVEYLTGLDTPQQFVHFVRLCMETGRDHALKTVYRIDGLGDLQRRWHKHATTSAIPQAASPSIARPRPVSH